MYAAPSNAQQSPVTAIDIALEPDATIIQHAQADNARLLKVFPKGHPRQRAPSSAFRIDAPLSHRRRDLFPSGLAYCLSKVLSILAGEAVAFGK